jgi:hypothetical protein
MSRVQLPNPPSILSKEYTEKLLMYDQGPSLYFLDKRPRA